ncbi:single-stranded DNA-binding protein [Aliterella atlantica]|uniref:Uncharacterized protein n=1 Tax=Aliterella atlantica CENA595 TaxID=1618023 RepID=A0A0D8ZYD1_9CYAN|nr:single-stranded DNA-binding protein [Aliterella atlantica]KJH72206.1 hypothetical protein UH38_09095 [Aliterella atlantica CENA595]
MTPQEFQTYINHQRLEIEATNRIADAIEKLTAMMEKMLKVSDTLERIALLIDRMLPAKAPDVVFDISQFATFDWASIGVVVVQKDESGPTVVNWRGQPFFRRSPNNKFAAAIWFSRCIGKDERGENTYERLCTFKSLGHIEVEPISDKVKADLSRSPRI